MSQLGSQERPLRVAVIGSGPSGFYAAGALAKAEKVVNVDIFDRLPTPFVSSGMESRGPCQN